MISNHATLAFSAAWTGIVAALLILAVLVWA